jgi:hypothetical protein
MRKKIMNFGLSFIIFGVLENFLRIYIEFTSLWVFINCLTKFTWIWNPISNSSFQFKGLNQNHSITKFEQNLKEFKPKPNLNWISIWIIQKKLEKFTIHVGYALAHGHSGTLGWGPAAWPNLAACGQPTPVGAQPELFQGSRSTLTARGHRAGRGELTCTSMET